MSYETEKVAGVALTRDEADKLSKLLKHPDIQEIIKQVEKKDK